MINLAGVEDCDKTIKRELERCGINIVAVPKENTEVPFTLTGELYGFKFIRAWYYWCVEGMMPIEYAKKLYYDSVVGKEDIRVAGHCGCPPPEEWIIKINENDKTVIPNKKYDELVDWVEKGRIDKKYIEDYIPERNTTEIKEYIMSYHIDSELGLYLFAQTIREMKGETEND